jgi:hypothetical protein
MIVLCDRHHHSLYESLRMLFEDRFGWQLYHIYDMEWWDEKVWNWERHMPHGEPVARQYLEPWPTDRDCGDHWERDDPAYPGRVMKMLTMAQARDMKPDIVLATLTENETGLHGFAKEIGAKFGIQVGNQGTENRYDLLDFALFSTTRFAYPWVPYVTYRQEFDLNDFRFEYPPSDPTFVGTWVQAMPTGDMPAYEFFMTLARALPDLKFRYHGHVGPVDDFWGGNVVTTKEVADQMRSARVGLHLKTWSDGYGHVLHNIAAVGRPLVGTGSYYHDKLGAPLWVEGVTSWDVQIHTTAETVDFIRRLTVDDELHERMSRAMAARFRELVNFDAEAEQIREMFDKVLSDRRVPA